MQKRRGRGGRELLLCRRCWPGAVWLHLGSSREQSCPGGLRMHRLSELQKQRGATWLDAGLTEALAQQGAKNKC